MKEIIPDPMTFRALFRLTRFWNLLIIGIAQYFTAGFLIDPSFVTHWSLLALASSTILIAAAGYIINDYYDIKIDLINKPDRVVIGRNISRRYAILLHSVLSIAGIVAGFLVNWQVGVINFFSAVLLWWYSNFLKRQPFVGNLAIGLLTGTSILVVHFLYKGLPSTTVVVYALFAFFMTLVREIIKDIEDLKGDNTFGCRTLPIVWGVRKTKNLIYVLTLLFLGTILFVHIAVEPLPLFYFLFFLFVPVSWLLIRLTRADTKKDFYRLSILCKVIMLLGVLSMAVI